MNDFLPYAPCYDTKVYITLETALTYLLQNYLLNDSVHFASGSGANITKTNYTEGTPPTIYTFKPYDIANSIGYKSILSLNENTFNSRYGDVVYLTFTKHWDDFCVILRSDFKEYPDIDSGQLKKIKRRFAEFFGMLEEKSERFAPLLNHYREQYDYLLKQLETSTDTIDRYNDTPQVPDDGTLDEDPYVTNLRKGKASTLTDAGSIPSQLEECYRYLHNILEDWSRELDRFFIPNLEEEMR